MKKSFAILLAVLMCVSLFTACSASGKSDKKSLPKGTWVISEVTGEDANPKDYADVVIELFGDGEGISYYQWADSWFGRATIAYDEKTASMNGETYSYTYKNDTIKLTYDRSGKDVTLTLERTSKTTSWPHETGHKSAPRAMAGEWVASEAYYNGRSFSADTLQHYRLTLNKDGTGTMTYEGWNSESYETIVYNADTFTAFGEVNPYTYDGTTIKTTVYYDFSNGLEITFVRK